MYVLGRASDSDVSQASGKFRQIQGDQKVPVHLNCDTINSDRYINDVLKPFLTKLSDTDKRNWLLSARWGYCPHIKCFSDIFTNNFW